MRAGNSAAIGAVPRTTTLTTIAGAAGSIALMTRAARHQKSWLLFFLFGIWVLAPFAAAFLARKAARRWPSIRQVVLDWLVIVLTAGSLVIYGGVAFGYLRAKPGFVFLVVPLASMISIGLVLLAVRSSAGARTG